MGLEERLSWGKARSREHIFTHEVKNEHTCFVTTLVIAIYVYFFNEKCYFVAAQTLKQSQ